MVGLALSLRLALLKNNLRSAPGGNMRQTAFGLSVVFASGLALLSLLLMAASRGRAVADDGAVLLFTLLLVGWLVLPLITFGGDDLLDPARLALLPLTRRDRMTVLGVAGLVGVPAAATLLSALGLVVATAYGPSTYAVALVAAWLEVALCVVVSRLAAAALSGLLRSRRGRDIGVAISLLLALSAQLLNLAMQRFIRPGSGTRGLHRFAEAIQWSPSALLARAPSLAREGRPGAAIASLTVVALLLVALAVIWERQVTRALERVDASGGRRRRTPLRPELVSSLSGAGRVGGIVAKDLRYVVRDPRRLISLLMGTLMPAGVLVVGPLGAGTGLPAWTVFVGCFIALFGGLGGSNRFGQDGTATWLLLATRGDRRDARRDLLGGDLAVLLVMTPLLLAATLAVALLGAGDRYLLLSLGLAGALLLTAVGASGIPSVLVPFTVPDNPRNAFNGGGAGQGCLAGLVSLGCMAGCVVLNLPLLALLIPGLGSPGWALVMLLAGPIYGAVLGATLRRIAARLWAERGADVMQVLVSTQR